MRLTQIIEALLFASDAPLSAGDLARIDERLDEDTVEAVIQELRSEYDLSERSFQIYEVAGGYQILTRPEFVAVLDRYETVPQTTRLSGSALEVLAVIAYRQPIGRAEVEEIRGVGSSGVIKTLLDRELIHVVGRSEGLGRPLLYGTTDRFLEHFGFRSIEDLPRPDELPVVLRERPIVPEAEVGSGTTAEAEAGAGAEADVGAEAQAGAGADAQSGAGADAQAGAGADAASAADAGPAASHAGEHGAHGHGVVEPSPNPLADEDVVALLEEAEEELVEELADEIADEVEDESRVAEAEPVLDATGALIDVAVEDAAGATRVDAPASATADAEPAVESGVESAVESGTEPDEVPQAAGDVEPALRTYPASGS